MDLKNVLAQLRDEREAIDSAINHLERLENSGRRGPGRPPGLTARSPTNGANGNSRPPSPSPREE